jgi:hypothetical protein
MSATKMTGGSKRKAHSRWNSEGNLRLLEYQHQLQQPKRQQITRTIAVNNKSKG